HTEIGYGMASTRRRVQPERQIIELSRSCRHVLRDGVKQPYGHAPEIGASQPTIGSWQRGDPEGNQGRVRLDRREDPWRLPHIAVRTAITIATGFKAAVQDDIGVQRRSGEPGQQHCQAKYRSEEHTSELQSLTNLVCR